MLQLLGEMQDTKLRTNACFFSVGTTVSGKASQLNTALKLLRVEQECGEHVSNTIMDNATINAFEEIDQ